MMILELSKTLVPKLYPLSHPLILNTTRNYAFKSDLKIKWVRPEKIPCIKPQKSGDLKPLEPINPDRLVSGLEESKIVESIDPEVRKLFTSIYNPRSLTNELIRKDMVEKVKSHEYDTFSMEARIAAMTANVRSLQETMEKFPRNKKVKVILKELIDRRKKQLKHLRRMDYKRFEWLLEKLDIEFRPPPSEFHWITRKDSLRKLTDKYCDDLKQERLNAYRQVLQSKQESFLKEKISTLEFIRKEQIECNVAVTVSEEEIDEVRKSYKALLEKKGAEQKEAV